MAVRVEPGTNFAVFINGESITFAGAEKLSYTQLHDRYAFSEFGVFHADQPARYSQNYSYERERMITDLGDDVHPVRHMLYTERQHVRPFLSAQIDNSQERFSIPDIAGMCVGALVHDLGECTHPAIEQALGYSIGDISWETKHLEDGHREVAIRRFLYDELYPDIPDELIEKAESVIERTEGDFLSEGFNLVERIGYFTTAMRAGEVALQLVRQEAEAPSPRLTQLARLAVRVSNFHRDYLRQGTERFPYASQVLQGHAYLDEQIHETLSSLVAAQADQAA